MSERLIVAAALIFGLFVPAGAKAQQSCEDLAKLGSPPVAVTSAKSIEASSFTPEGGRRSLSGLPAFCRVAATIKPTSDSNIGVEIWLPASNWNGKFLAVGNGGWAGVIPYSAMADALRRGYATSGTDDGHQDDGGSFVMGHPEKLIDYAYRSEHEMAVEAKSLIKAFYGRGPRHSYWQGCSAGGREGLLQAYRYPDEFDGIVAGDPANIRRNAWALWLANETFKDPAAHIPAEKYPMIHQFVLDACDANDGLKDGLIEKPESCHPDFKALECKGDDAANCLTARQVQSAQTIISPAVAPDGKELFPRLEPGTELQWARLAGGPAPGELFWDEYRYVVYQNPQWDWRTFNLDRDAAKAHAVDKDVDEMNPDLRAFAQHAGKLLIYHGWADQQVAPGSSIEFYKAAATLSGDPSESANWIRLFMVPGMNHCFGGEGPDKFDALGAMEKWVDKGEPPAEIVATKASAGHVERTRPLCPYPQIAQYKGSGSIDHAANFSCAVPR